MSDVFRQRVMTMLNRLSTVIRVKMGLLWMMQLRELIPQLLQMVAVVKMMRMKRNTTNSMPPLGRSYGHSSPHDVSILPFLVNSECVGLPLRSPICMLLGDKSSGCWLTCPCMISYHHRQVLNYSKQLMHAFQLQEHGLF